MEKTSMDLWPFTIGLIGISTIDRPFSIAKLPEGFSFYW
jgi:hypothetical protein